MKHSILIESVTKKLLKRTCNDIVVRAYWIELNILNNL